MIYAPFNKGGRKPCLRGDLNQNLPAARNAHRPSFTKRVKDHNPPPPARDRKNSLRYK